jgi:uncharacterized protein (TIGR02145 family)
MKLLSITSAVLLTSLGSLSLTAQVCDPSVVPNGLISTYAPGAGVLLQWDAIPGSVGVQLRVDLPSGPSIRRKIVGFEKDLFLVSESFLTPGTYTWRVQAACSTIPPFFDATFISAPSSFTIGDTTSSSTCPATVTDIDGNVYNTVEIGDQCWTQENLKVEHYRNGDPIPTGLSNSAWSTTTSGSFALHNDVAANKEIYGLLYNWYTSVDSRGLCPSGWHIPSDGEWIELTDFLGGAAVSGGAMKAVGTLSLGTGLWQTPNLGATNSSGFQGLPGGHRGSGTGNYFNVDFIGFWWSSSENSSNFSSARLLEYNSINTPQNSHNKRNGFSVRCLQD